MMEYLIKWVKNIAIFYIISTLVQNLVPDGKYLKYIKLFLGIVMVILLIRPLGELIGATDDYNKIYLQAGVDEMSAELKAGLEAADEERSRIVVGEYTDRIKSDIQEYVTGLGAGYKDSSVTIDTYAASDTFFTGFISKSAEPMICVLVFLIATTVVVAGGVKGGVERVSTIMMPVLIVLLIGVS